MPTRFNYSVLLFVFILSPGSFDILEKGDKCSLKDGSEGICKLITECPTAVQLTRKKVIPVICGFEETESIVCCKEDEEVMEITRTTTNPVTNRTPGDISKQKCKEYAEYAYEKVFAPTLLLKPHITKRLVCDIPRNRLVVGSSLASRREFPHMALIGHKPEGSDTNWHCGGSLISENFVLTAAQCLFAASLTRPILVRVGVTNKTDLSQMQERTVSEIIIHPEFNSTSTYYDIGLLRFSKNVEFNTYIRPACLQTEKFIPSVLAIASGWGVIGFGEETSNDLLATVLEFYGAEECNNKYRLDASSDRLKAGIVDDMIICTGISKSERSTCEGDAGGPLQIYHKETEEVKCMYDIIGVISYGNPCGFQQSGLIDIFTRVSVYLKWIEDIVWPN